MPNEPPPPQVITSTRNGRTYTRTITARLICWRCEWCGAEHEDWRYPGPPPRYCEERPLGKRHSCKQDAQNALAAGQARRKRQAAQAAEPSTYRRPVGRPRQV